MHDEKISSKRFRRYAKNEKKLQRLINQTKLKSYRRDVFWKFGVQVPRTHQQAIELDKKNRNKKWQEAEAIEMEQLLEYKHLLMKEKVDKHQQGTRRFVVI